MPLADTTAVAAAPTVAAAVQALDNEILTLFPGANLTNVKAGLNLIVAEVGMLLNPDPSSVAKIKSDLATVFADAKTTAGDLFHGLAGALHPAAPAQAVAQSPAQPAASAAQPGATATAQAGAAASPSAPQAAPKS